MQPSSLAYYDFYSSQLAPQPWVDRGALGPFLECLAGISNIVDLGCGLGDDLAILAGAGHQVLGLDASKPALEAVAERLRRYPLGVGPGQGQGSIETQLKNILFWSPKPAEWDGVWIHRTLQHLSAEESQRVIATAFRGLKPFGWLGLVVPEGQGTFEEKGADLQGPSRWIHQYQEHQICSMVEQTGFRIERVGRRTQNAGIKKAEPELMILAQRI
jgi:SAM-dependent methyltransferase